MTRKTITVRVRRSGDLDCFLKIPKKKAKKTITVRVRRYSGHVDSPNYYHHADIICKSKAEALAAAREGRVTNWRWIDSFDTSSSDYEDYEILYTLHPGEAENPRKPITKTQKKAQEKLLARKALK